jgi:hypothetical protein
MSTPSPYEVARDISSNFGKQIQKSMDTSALDQILQQAKKAQTPIENLDLISQAIKNVSPEMRGDVINYLNNRFSLAREQAGNEEFMRGGSSYPSGQGIAPQGTQQPQSTQMPSVTPGTNVPIQGAVPAQPSVSLRELGMKPREIQATTQDIDQRARELMIAFPMRYKNNVDQARQAAAQEQSAQAARLNETNAAFDEYVKRALEKGDITPDIIGEMQNEYLLNARNEAIEGKKAPAAIANDASKKLLDFAKARSKLRATTGLSVLVPFYGKTRQSLADTFVNARKLYENEGRLNLLVDDLVHVGLNKPTAALIAKPTTSNRPLNEFLNSAQKRFSISDAARTLLGKKSVRKPDEVMFNDVTKMIKPNDSLLSIGARLYSLGYDPGKFLSFVSKENTKRNFLNKDQETELVNPPSFQPSLTDLEYYTGIGKNLRELIYD